MTSAIADFVEAHGRGLVLVSLYGQAQSMGWAVKGMFGSRTQLIARPYQTVWPGWFDCSRPSIEFPRSNEG